MTLVSLSGLGNLGRIAGFVAILYSATSMISVVLASFRDKTDLERAVVYMGESLVMLSVSPPYLPIRMNETQTEARCCDVLATGFPRMGNHHVYHYNHVVPRFRSHLSEYN